MKILLLMDPDIPVPPVLYGGIERIVYMLALEYQNMGHSVTVMAGPGSKVPCGLEVFGSQGSEKPRWVRWAEVWAVWSYLGKNADRFDVIHNFGRLVYFLPILNHPVKKVMSYQREITGRNIRFATRLPHKNLIFTANSDSCAATGNARGQWTTVYNGVFMDSYTFQPVISEDAPLIFLGRLDKIKGAHHAIRIAKSLNKRLILAGNKPHLAHEIQYYRKEIEPFIDGKQIISVGAVNDEQKNFYLGQSQALLFPIEWEEPFGIVMIEALACGTPVIGIGRGAVPEVIEHGRTGFVCRSIEEMIQAVSAGISGISRKACRESCEDRFSSRVIAKHYLSLFEP